MSVFKFVIQVILIRKMILLLSLFSLMAFQFKDNADLNIPQQNDFSGVAGVHVSSDTTRIKDLVEYGIKTKNIGYIVYLQLGWTKP